MQKQNADLTKKYSELLKQTKSQFEMGPSQIQYRTISMAGMLKQFSSLKDPVGGLADFDIGMQLPQIQIQKRVEKSYEESQLSDTESEELDDHKFA